MQFKYAFDKSQYGSYDDMEQTLGANWHKRIFDVVLAGLVSSIYPNGLPAFMARQYNRILNAVDLSPDDKITVETADVEFLKSVLTSDKVSVPPAQVRIYCLLCDELSKAAS